MADAKVDIIISAKDQASPVFKKLGASAADVGKTMALGMAGAAAGVAAGLGAAVKAATDFEKQMSGVRAASGASAEQMAQLSDLSLRLGKDTSKSAMEAAAGIEELVKAGIPVSDVLGGAAQAAINLSEATGTDVKTAAEVAAAAMATFGKTGEEMAAVTDTVTGAVNQSKLDVGEFALGIAQAGQAVSIAGGSFEDAAVALTAMSREGLSGSDAGTALKNMYISLAAPTDKATKLMRELGLATADGKSKFFDAAGSVKSYAEIGGVLEEALAGMTNQQRVATLETLFGRDAFRAADTAAGLGAEGVGKLSEAVTKQGQAAEGARARNDNLAGDIERLSGAAQTAAIKFGQPFQKPLREAAQALAQFVDEGVIPAVESFGPVFVERAEKAGEALAGPGSSLLENAKDAAKDGLGALGEAMDETGKQLAPWAAENEKAGQVVEDALSSVHSTADSLTFLLEGNFPAAAKSAATSMDQWDRAMEGSKAIIGELADATGTTVQSIVQTVQSGWQEVQSTSQSIWNAIPEDIRTDLGLVVSAVGEKLGEAATAAGDKMGEMSAAIGAKLSEIAGIVGPQAAAIGQAIIDGIGGAIRAGMGWVGEQAAAVARAALASAKAALGVESPSREFAEIGDEIVAGLVEGIEASIPEAEDAAAELAESVIESMSTELEQGMPEAEVVAIDLGQTVVDAIAAGLGKVKTIEGAADALKGTVAGAMRDLAGDIDRINSELDRKFSEVGQRAARAIASAVEDANDSIGKTISDAADKIRDLQSSLLEGRGTRVAREALQGRLSAVDLARSRFREEEDLQRDRAREDKRNAEQLQRDIEKARTAEEVAGIIERHSEMLDDLKLRRKAEDEDRAYRRQRDDEDRDFRKQQEKAVRDFEDDLEDKALAKSIERAETDRDNRIKAIQDALDEKKAKIEEDARYEQQKLAESARERIQTLKDEFIAKLPGLTSQASAIVEQFLAGIDQALQRTASLAAAAAAAIGSVGNAGGGGGGGAGAANHQLVSAFTVPLAGGGSMTVNASDLAAAIDNVIQQGGTPASDDTRFVHQFEHGGVVPGPQGEPQWAIVHGGETVVPNGMTTGTTINVTNYISGSVMTEQDLAESIRQSLVRTGRRNIDIFGGLA